MAKQGAALRDAAKAAELQLGATRLQTKLLGSTGRSNHVATGGSNADMHVTGSELNGTDGGGALHPPDGLQLSNKQKFGSMAAVTCDQGGGHGTETRQLFRMLPAVRGDPWEPEDEATRYERLLKHRVLGS